MSRTNLTDWLFRNKYGYIYAEWLDSPEKTFNDMPLGEWLQEKHPDVWKEYNEFHSGEPTTRI